VLGLTVSSNDPLLQLPNQLSNQIRNFPGGFIVMAERAGIPVIPHIINFVMIVATLSVASADLYVTVCHSLRDSVNNVEPMPFSNGISGPPEICPKMFRNR